MFAARNVPGLIFACLAAVSLAAPIEAGIAFDARNYELAFDKNSHELAHAEWAAFNEETLNRIAKLLKRIKDWREVRLVFVGPRPSCGPAAQCDAEQLTRLRIERVLERAKDRLKGADGLQARIPFSLAFFDEIEDARSLPSLADSLTLLLEHAAGETCAGGIRLEEPSLPLALASGRPVYGFVLNKGESAPVDENTELFFSGAASPLLIVWEDGRGRFRKQDASSGDQRWRLPPGAERLYLIAGPRSNAQASRFGASLGNDFAALPRPSFLPLAKGGRQKASLAPSDKGFDDNLHRLEQGAIRPGPGDAAATDAEGESSEVAVCDFEFVRR